MRSFSLFFFVIVSFSVFSQDNFKLYYEETDQGFIVLADNDEYTPVSAKINFRLENLKPDRAHDIVYVIPAKTQKYVLTALNVIDRSKRIKFGFESSYNYGDHTLTKYDTNFKYYLPFKKGMVPLPSIPILKRKAP